MKHLLLFLTLLLFLAACHTTKTVSKNSEVEVIFRDSVIIRDSIIYRHLTATIDSVVIRDSVIIIKDSAGNIVGKERYRTADRLRNRNENISDSQLYRQEKKQQQKYRAFSNVNSKFTSTSYLAFIAQMTALCLALCVAVFILFKSRGLWMYLLKMVRR